MSEAKYTGSAKVHCAPLMHPTTPTSLRRSNGFVPRRVHIVQNAQRGEGVVNDAAAMTCGEFLAADFFWKMHASSV
jgi:hypothetical protein